MRKPKLLIIGTGLGGSALAQALLPWAEVTMVDLAPAQIAALPPLEDRGRPANVAPLYGLGLGGTTQFWHNGLIPLPPRAYESWPYPASTLAPYVAKAYPLLSPASAPAVATASQQLQHHYAELGLSGAPLGETLYYPHRRRNLWQYGKLATRVTLLRAQALPCDERSLSASPQLTVQYPDGTTASLSANAIILAAGGLVTPRLLQPIAPQAGYHYEDHATAFVGEVMLNPVFAQLWNYQPRGLGGSLRQPFVIGSPLGDIAFYLRPAYHAPGSQANQRRKQLTSTLAQLRNQPYNPALLWQLFRRADDLADIASLKLGITLPTPYFSLMMMASQPPATTAGVGGAWPACWRNWSLSDAALGQLQAAVERAMAVLAPLSQQQFIYSDWAQTLASSAHHNGTARLARTPAEGVCDSHGQVFGSHALYVADASALPSSSYANTGLTIAALALKLADHLKERLNA